MFLVAAHVRLLLELHDDLDRLVATASSGGHFEHVSGAENSMEGCEPAPWACSSSQTCTVLAEVQVVRSLVAYLDSMRERSSKSANDATHVDVE